MLHKKLSIRELKEALTSLPTKLHETYEDAIQRIQGQSEDESRRALRALSWTSHVVQPLTVRALQHAFAIRLGDEKFDRDGITEKNRLVGLCAGLVEV